MDARGIFCQFARAKRTRVVRVARIAKESDYDEVVATIVAAFQDDPTWAWMFPDPGERADQHATVFGLYVESALPNHGVWMADDRASAVAVFTAPGERELSESAEARLEPFLLEALGDHAPAVLTTFERFEAAIPQGRPFYYLSFLGTRPDSRGQGLGMGLLAELVARADRDGQPTYLESTNPANNPRYGRLGFKEQNRFNTSDELHTVTTMWREPAVSR
jgi:GNAT superfamily N-acetyltransferase